MNEAKLIELLKEASWTINLLLGDSTCECDKGDPYCLRQDAEVVEREVDAFLVSIGETL